MTAKEAILTLRRCRIGDVPDEEFEGAFEMAIKALEKQMPYKPQVYEDKYYGCKCGNNLLLKWEKYPIKLMPKSKGLPRCLVCGQKLDWGE